MPSKPDKYGIKIWVCNDAENAYCLAFQVYTGRPFGEQPERNQGQRVVLELTTELLQGVNVTTDNFFTSVPLAIALLNRRNPMTLVGTLRKNKPDIPRELLEKQGREAHTSRFGFDKKMTIVSYIPKARRNVILISSQHHNAEIYGQATDYKPEIYYSKILLKVEWICSI